MTFPLTATAAYNCNRWIIDEYWHTCTRCTQLAPVTGRWRLDTDYTNYLCLERDQQLQLHLIGWRNTFVVCLATWDPQPAPGASNIWASRLIHVPHYLSDPAVSYHVGSISLQIHYRRSMCKEFLVTDMFYMFWHKDREHHSIGLLALATRKCRWTLGSLCLKIGRL